MLFDLFGIFIIAHLGGVVNPKQKKEENKPFIFSL